MTLLLVLTAGALVLGIVAAVISVRGVKKELHQRANKLHEIAVTEIRNVVPGTLVRVLGTAVATGETTVAPHSGRPCIAFDAKLKYLPPQLSNTPMRSLDSRRILPFMVDDDTGTIAVDVENVELVLAAHELELEGEHVKGFGDGILTRELSRAGGDGKIEHWERRLEPDHPVAVIGEVQRTDDGTLRLTGSKDRPLVISNIKAAFEPDPSLR